MLSGFRSRQADVLGNSHREFVAARNAPNYDIVLLDSDGLEFRDRALEEGIDYGLVPPCVNDCDPKG